MNISDDLYKNIKYAIIDMYTYTYFNYDISMTNNAVLYYENSGYREDEKHNFDNNKNFTGTIQEELDKRQQMYEDREESSFQDEDKKNQHDKYQHNADKCHKSSISPVCCKYHHNSVTYVLIITMECCYDALQDSPNACCAKTPKHESRGNVCCVAR